VSALSSYLNSIKNIKGTQMPSLTANLTPDWQKIIEFVRPRPLYFHLEIRNFEGESLEFTMGDPTISPVVLTVPDHATVTRDNFPLVGQVHARTTQGNATITFEYW
jgi:hypothetical protein